MSCRCSATGHIPSSSRYPSLRCSRRRLSHCSSWWLSRCSRRHLSCCSKRYLRWCPRRSRLSCSRRHLSCPMRFDLKAMPIGPISCRRIAAAHVPRRRRELKVVVPIGPIRCRRTATVRNPGYHILNQRHQHHITGRLQHQLSHQTSD